MGTGCARRFLGGNTLGPGRHPAHGNVVGSILLLAAVANMLMLPYPVWFWVLNLVIFTAADLLGAKWGQARPSDGQTVARYTPPG